MGEKLLLITPGYEAGGRFACKSSMKVSKRSVYYEKLGNIPVSTKIHIPHYSDLKSKTIASKKGIKTVTKGLRISPTGAT